MVNATATSARMATTRPEMARMRLRRALRTCSLRIWAALRRASSRRTALVGRGSLVGMGAPGWDDGMGGGGSGRDRGTAPPDAADEHPLDPGRDETRRDEASAPDDREGLRTDAQTGDGPAQEQPDLAGGPHEQRGQADP